MKELGQGPRRRLVADPDPEATLKHLDHLILARMHMQRRPHAQQRRYILLYIAL